MGSKVVAIGIGLGLVLFVGCESNKGGDGMPRSQAFREAADLGHRKVKGQKVYVPIYSSLPTWQKDRFVNLTAVLSIRNISMKHDLVVSKVSYYDTNGKLLREYIEKPFSLKPIGTREFTIHEDDVSGGIGANFIVEWESAHNISIPIIESVMLTSKGVQAFSFVSRGKEIEAH